MNILVIDDDAACCSLLYEIVAGMEFSGKKANVFRALNGKEALKIVVENELEIVISDVGLPDIDGYEIARVVKQTRPRAAVILVSGNEDIIKSINSIELGIFDFLIKPVDVDKLTRLIRKAERKTAESGTENLSDLSSLPEKEKGLIDLGKMDSLIDQDFGEFVKGNFAFFSEKMKAIYSKVKKLQDYPQIPLLIRGETGTGKDVLAKFSHYENPSASGPFIAINCSNLNRELFESELFGYEKGSFTGAVSSGKEGKIKAADNGTLFLDEVTEIPLDLQAKLLRVIEDREYYSVGSTRTQKVKARFVFASNRDIQEMIKKGTFREDLYFRLNTCEVTIPPLRERKDEIIPLSVFLLNQIGRELGKPVSRIEKPALKQLENYSFPGNVRELRNIITKAVLFSESDTVSEQNILDLINLKGGKKMLEKINPEVLEIPDQPFCLDDLVDAIIKKTLAKFSGNKTKAAEFLGLKRDQFYGRFKNIDRDE